MIDSPAAKFRPDVLVSLTAPKKCAAHFDGTASLEGDTVILRCHRLSLAVIGFDSIGVYSLTP